MNITKNMFVSYRQWDSYKRRCENAELKRCGKCRLIGDFFGKWIVEIREDHKLILTRPGWKEAMKHAANVANIPLGYIMRGNVMCQE